MKEQHNKGFFPEKTAKYIDEEQAVRESKFLKEGHKGKEREHRW